MAALPEPDRVARELWFKMENKVLIFIKNPVLGAVKTRLAADIGEEPALKVYRELLSKTRELAEQLEAEVYVYYSDFIDESDAWNAPHMHRRLQFQGDLGQRLSRACAEIEASAFSKLILIGSDCYDLSVNHLKEAFQQLDTCDLVLGPANDGGYYLMGIKSAEPALFKNINWSTESVLEETIKAAQAKKLNFHLLEELIDLDTFEDLKLSGFPKHKLQEDAGKN